MRAEEFRALLLESNYHCFRCLQDPRRPLHPLVDRAHIEPRRNGGTESAYNFLVLCPNHHREMDWANREYATRDLFNEWRAGRKEIPENERHALLANGRAKAMPPAALLKKVADLLRGYRLGRHSMREALFLEGAAYRRLGEFLNAFYVLRWVRELTDPGELEWVSRIESAMALVLSRLGDRSSAMRLAESGVSAAKKGGLRGSALVDVLNGAAQVYIEADRADKFKQFVSSMRHQVEVECSVDSPEQLTFLAHVAEATNLAGDGRAARRIAKEIRRNLEGCYPIGAAFRCANIGFFFQSEGEGNPAVENYVRAAKKLVELGDDYLAGAAYLWAGSAAAREAKARAWRKRNSLLEKALVYIKEGKRCMDRTHSVYQRPGALAWMAEINELLGEREEAIRHMGDAIRDLRRLREKPKSTTIWTPWAEASLSAGGRRPAVLAPDVDMFFVDREPQALAELLLQNPLITKADPLLEPIGGESQ